MIQQNPQGNNWIEAIFKEIMVVNWPEMKNTQEVQNSPYRININNFMHRIIVVKVQTTKNNI